MPRTFLPALAFSLAVLSVGCEPAPLPVEFRFDVRFDNGPIDCTADAAGRALTDLRFYVHDVTVTTDDGRTLPVTLTPDALWQSDRVALLDFEDGEGSCRNGSLVQNRSVRGTLRLADPGKLSGVAFNVGVPAALNHANPLVSEPPLTYTVMHWHWRSGYKFMRAGVQNSDDAAWLHLGSARCGGVIGNLRGCEMANRPRVALAEFNIERDVIVIDVARLFGPTQLGDGEAWSCESGVNEDHCRLAFAELGIDSATGETMGSAPAFYKLARQ